METTFDVKMEDLPLVARVYRLHPRIGNLAAPKLAADVKTKADHGVRMSDIIAAGGRKWR